MPAGSPATETLFGFGRVAQPGVVDEVDDGQDGAQAGGRFAGALKLFALAASLGSTESLVVAPQMMRGRDLTPDQLRTSAVTEGTVRLSIGLEDVDDLMEDITQALSAGPPPPGE